MFFAKDLFYLAHTRFCCFAVSGVSGVSAVLQ